NGADALAERAVAMARAAPEDPYAGLADRSELARTIPELDLLDPDLPAVDRLENLALTAEAAALAVPHVAKSGRASASARGRRRRVARGRRHGAGDESRLQRRLPRIAPQRLRHGHCRRRTGDGARLRFLLRAARRRSR